MRDASVCFRWGEKDKKKIFFKDKITDGPLIFPFVLHEVGVSKRINGRERAVSHSVIGDEGHFSPLSRSMFFFERKKKNKIERKKDCTAFCISTSDLSLR